MALQCGVEGEDFANQTRGLGAPTNGNSPDSYNSSALANRRLPTTWSKRLKGFGFPLKSSPSAVVFLSRFEDFQVLASGIKLSPTSLYDVVPIFASICPRLHVVSLQCNGVTYQYLPEDTGALESNKAGVALNRSPSYVTASNCLYRSRDLK